MTNGERIRSMSDEELVDSFYESMEADINLLPGKLCTDTPIEKCNLDCHGCFINWLKQEAK